MALRQQARTVALAGLVVAGSVLCGEAGAQNTASCDTPCLKGFIDGYIDALSHRDVTKLPVVKEVKYTENGRVLDLGEGFWHTAGAPIRYRDYVFDPSTGSVAAFTALKEYDATAEMFVRLKIATNKITEIETFVVRAGDQRWFAPQNLEHMSDLFAQTVPAAERHTREQLVATANSYFDAIQTEGTPQFKQAPFAPGMKRFENGLQTTNVTSNPIMERHTWSPDLQLERASYKGTMVMDRRFPIVDLERGTVLAVGTFRREGRDTSTLLLAEMFKVTGGKLREIRAVILNLPNGAGTGWDNPDLSGIWMQDRGSWVIDKLPFTPAGAAKHASKKAPNAVEACTVHYFGQIITGPLPVEILQSDNRVTLLYENDHEVRRIFMDGRGHPNDLDPTTMGHSIGRWDGATLVIDTVGVREGWFRPEGVPYTDKAHVIERLTLDKGGDTIHVALTLEDPEYYAKPVEVTREFKRMHGGEILEDLCVVSEYLYH